MSQQDPIDWSKVITNRAPPIQTSPHAVPYEHEVYDLFGPCEPVHESAVQGRNAQLAS